jgi:hypothetical protein
MLGETSNRGGRHVTDMRRTTLRALLVVAAVGLAVGVFGGVAAADHAGDSKIDSNTSVTVNDEGGYFHVLCTGSPTEHECDKQGELDAGPAGVDYEGFNDDSLENRSSRFGDRFVVTVDGEEYTFSFTCDLSDEPPEDNPCPVDPPGEDGDDGSDGNDSNDDSDRRDDRRENSRSPDHANGP